jgi:DNA-binding NtrC family response regulator
MRNDARKVLVVEDDPSLRELLLEELEDFEQPALQPTAVESAEDARSRLEGQDFALVISDLRLPGADGFDLLRYAGQVLDEPPAFIMITAFGTVARAVDALRSGASDFLTKPLDLDHFRVSVGRALEARALKQQLRRYQEVLEGDDFHGMLGESDPMRHLFEEIRRVARVDGPVLITGESGTGKELAAQAVHKESPRKDGPFVAINCAGIPRELLESEFFGHVPGAFTGATGRRDGLFLAADRGTLFLDEIAAMPTELQAKLLRVLEDGHVRPLGSSVEIPVDVRIVAASNVDLEDGLRQADREGSFRKDLFYRLETFALRIPPLRERGDDLELLTGYFWNRSRLKMGKDIPEIAPETMRQLQRYPFPGNVRELKNAIERAVAFCDGAELLPSHLPKRIREHGPGDPIRVRGQVFLPPDLIRDGRLPPLRELEALYVRYVLERVGGNKRQAASLLGVSRRTLYRYLGNQEPD